MPERGLPAISERTIVKLWQQQVSNRQAFKDSEGSELEVVYPGRPNDSRGGDFKDAVVVSPEGRRQGYIEVHTLTSGWQAHGHHLDPHYNQVVLQVAWRADRGLPARSENGRLIPTVILEGRLPEKGAAIQTTWGLVCREHLAKRSPGFLQAALEEAGVQRFLQKSQRFQSRIETEGALQSLYEGLVESLGYSHNQKAFLDFARRLSLADCGKLLGREGLRDAARTQSFLLGQAGFLPSQRGWRLAPDDYSSRLERIWQENGWRALAPSPGWEYFRVRPGNYPVRRLMALSQWLVGAHFENWQANFLMLLLSQGRGSELSAMSGVFSAGIVDYWLHNFDFGRSLNAGPSVILGEERLSEMVVNVVLPFLLAWARGQNFKELTALITSLYGDYPPLASNTIQRHMCSQLALSPRELGSACRQQGLLHIYKTYCSRGLCESCPLGR